MGNVRLSLNERASRLATRLADVRGIPVSDVVNDAVEEIARAAGVSIEAEDGRRRQTPEEILAVGRRIAALPLLDDRSPLEIMDDINDR